MSGLLVGLIFAIALVWLLAGATLANLWLENILTAVLSITGLNYGKVISKAGDAIGTDTEGFRYLQFVAG